MGNVFRQFLLRIFVQKRVKSAKTINRPLSPSLKNRTCAAIRVGTFVSRMPTGRGTQGTRPRQQYGGMSQCFHPYCTEDTFKIPIGFFPAPASVSAPSATCSNPVSSMIDPEMLVCTSTDELVQRMAKSQIAGWVYRPTALGLRTLIAETARKSISARKAVFTAADFLVQNPLDQPRRLKTCTKLTLTCKTDHAPLVSSRSLTKAIRAPWLTIEPRGQTDINIFNWAPTPMKPVISVGPQTQDERLSCPAIYIDHQYGRNRVLRNQWWRRRHARLSTLKRQQIYPQNNKSAVRPGRFFFSHLAPPWARSATTLRDDPWSAVSHLSPKKNGSHDDEKQQDMRRSDTDAKREAPTLDAVEYFSPKTRIQPPKPTDDSTFTLAQCVPSKPLVKSTRESIVSLSISASRPRDRACQACDFPRIGRVFGVEYSVVDMC